MLGQFAEKTGNSAPVFDCAARAFYCLATSGSEDARGEMKTPISTAAFFICHQRLFILDKGKPVVRRGRKAMGPKGVARLPKG